MLFIPKHGLLFGKLRRRVNTMPLPHTTKAYGQLLGRDLNPLDLLLLLRTIGLFNQSFKLNCQAAIHSTADTDGRNTVVSKWPI